jgi:purine-binding chemotaxis protein CheW
MSRRPLQRDPLEVILAGREAAGCDEDQSLASGIVETAVDEYLEFLCFRVSDEIYGINIMDIKEIIKPREVTEVPRAPSFVSGIISLRGIIIPIIDMLDRLGLPREKVTGRERVIVVRHGESFSGLLVDEIIQVVHITKDCLEAAPAVLEGIDRDFVSGIGRADGRMIILLNLENIADIHLY